MDFSILFIKNVNTYLNNSLVAQLADGQKMNKQFFFDNQTTVGVI